MHQQRRLAKHGIALLFLCCRTVAYTMTFMALAAEQCSRYFENKVGVRPRQNFGPQISTAVYAPHGAWAIRRMGWERSTHRHFCVSVTRWRAWFAPVPCICECGFEKGRVCKMAGSVRERTIYGDLSRECTRYGQVAVWSRTILPTIGPRSIGRIVDG